MFRKSAAIAAAITTLAIPAAAQAAGPQPPSLQLTKTEALGAAFSLSPGRTFELARLLTPGVEYGQVLIVPDPSRISRLGRRTVVVQATVIVFRPATAPRRVGLLVRERLSGHRIVRVVS